MTNSGTIQLQPKTFRLMALAGSYQQQKLQVLELKLNRKRRYLGRYFAHPMMQNRRAKRDDYKPSAVRVTQRYVP
ncbi:hypothetical protein Psal006b_02315 [Piscirickettsia salmonis]|uniref:Pentapeptide repeats family protein n=2 Tax=Piscirickettsia salmonis TaxID=1238 RepID=A0AAC8VGJ2_PISSA|nr:hypothetical protein [Piscirickettsia salmonis]ALB22075.1 pentapeptide repeats family protein [Piscirickettsia salmonis]QGN99310.1 hypothetical protein Psal006b_02315 [Piscirickettsia salmonis]QGO02943.1 hypothetical protein Psal008_02335 [Piscirickettsia salmonis]QGO13602.1 hypothetical protein Psal010b_02311 [Piscirickettsia salmonis]QGO20678.1 hypothetical protein Psal013_02343 [Piscirickettsia salmonis]